MKALVKVAMGRGKGDAAMSGMMTSSTMRSGSASSTPWSAPLPSAAVVTSKPANRSEEASRSRILGSSSTTSR